MINILFPFIHIGKTDNLKILWKSFFLICIPDPDKDQNYTNPKWKNEVDLFSRHHKSPEEDSPENGRPFHYTSYILQIADTHKTPMVNSGDNIGKLLKCNFSYSIPLP